MKNKRLLRNFTYRLLMHAIALSLLATACSCTKKPTEADEIQVVFQKYRTALLERDGEAAWAVLDSHTQNFYATVLQDALSLPRRELSRLDRVHRFTVLRLRTDLRRAELQNMTGHDVLVMAVQNGWVSNASLAAMTNLSKVQVTGLYASAFVPESPKVPAFHFIKEGSEWKFSLVKGFGLINATFRQLQAESRLSEKDFLIHMLQQVSKYEVDERIWDGPLD